MTGIINILQRYASASAENPPASVNEDFSEIAEAAPSDHLEGGLNHAFRSDQTPPFESMLASMFGVLNGDQKAGILNQLLSSIPAGALSGGILGSLSRWLEPGTLSNTITPQQAERIPPEAVQELAKNVKQQDPSVIDRASSFYAEHPKLIQALGAGALAMIMSHISNRR